MKTVGAVVVLATLVGGCAMFRTPDAETPYALPAAAVREQTYDPRVLDALIHARCEDMARRVAPRAREAAWWSTNSHTPEIERALYRQTYDDCVEGR